MKKNMKNKAESKADGVKKQRKVRKARPDAKDAIKAEKAMLKDISSRGLKLFLGNRKTVSGIKKLTKLIAKHLTEANKTGNKKLVDHCVKMFGYIGFKYDAETNVVRWGFEAKVKPFKERKVKAAASTAMEEGKEEKPTKKLREKKPRKARAVRTKNPVAKKPEEVKPAEETPAQPATPPAEEPEKPIEIPVGSTTDLAGVEAGEQTVDDDDLPDGDEPDPDGDDDDDADDHDPADGEFRGDEASPEQAEARLEFFNGLNANGEDVDA